MYENENDCSQQYAAGIQSRYSSQAFDNLLFDEDEFNMCDAIENLDELRDHGNPV